MNIHRLFNALVLGGAVLATGCTSPKEKPPETMSKSAETPRASDAKEKEKPKAGEAAEEKADPEDKTGICSWL